jgi:hypothetical protein
MGNCIANQLKQVRTDTERTVEKICAGSARPDHPLTGDFAVNPSFKHHSPGPR